MGEHLIRLTRLKSFQKLKDWSDSELARQIGRSPQQVWSWRKGNRLIGEKLAREIEEALGMPRFWLDEREVVPLSPSTLGPPSDLKSVNKGDQSVNVTARPMPIVKWGELRDMLDIDNQALAKTAAHLESFAVASPKAKFVQMIDDSMAPTMQPGDHVLLDPAELPKAGDIVLVQLPNKEYFVRAYRLRTAYVFEAVATNPNYQSLSSIDDAAVVVAVMVEHRSYRRQL